MIDAQAKSDLERNKTATTSWAVCAVITATLMGTIIRLAMAVAVFPRSPLRMGLAETAAPRSASSVLTIPSFPCGIVLSPRITFGRGCVIPEGLP
jgi:hypothetical protein